MKSSFWRLAKKDTEKTWLRGRKQIKKGGGMEAKRGLFLKKKVWSAVKCLLKLSC